MLLYRSYLLCFCFYSIVNVVYCRSYRACLHWIVWNFVSSKFETNTERVSRIIFNKIYVIFNIFFFNKKWSFLGFLFSYLLLIFYLDDIESRIVTKFRSKIFPFQSFKSVFVNLHITIQRRVTRIFQVSQMWKFYRVQKYLIFINTLFIVSTIFYKSRFNKKKYKIIPKNIYTNWTLKLKYHYIKFIYFRTIWN